MSFLSERNSTFQQVKDFHLNSDVDQSFIAQHHTLGPLTNQASPGDHIHDGTTSKRLKLGDLAGESITFPVLGGTDGTQPTFSSAPLFTGSYTKIGNMCFFQIDVDMDNITNFGSGQYYVKLPFPSSHNYLLSNGCLHDISANDEYAILGHVLAGSDTLTLLSTASNGKQVPFTHNVPVTLATADNFHIAGTYEIQQ
jgi:hypothetical protein